MWKPQKFKAIYLFATLYVMTLTLPSAAAVYWAFGDLLLNHSNAFALLPTSPFRDMAVVLMLIHQACSPPIHIYYYGTDFYSPFFDNYIPFFFSLKNKRRCAIIIKGYENHFPHYYCILMYTFILKLILSLCGRIKKRIIVNRREYI